MKVRWLGHACFLVTSGDGVRVITDPYAVDGGISHAPVTEAADVVLVSHDHFDHSDVSTLQGRPEVVRGSRTRTVKGIPITGVVTYHDSSQGGDRGTNTVFCFTVDDIKLCHLGDLGHVLSEEQVEEIGPVDILLVPVGGFYTIGPSEASQICDQLKPKVVIPMHFRTPRCAFPIADAEEFLEGKENVRRVAGSEVEVERGTLPAVTEFVLLQPAL